MLKRLTHIHNTIKTGWQEFNLYFYIGGVAAIIGGFFEVAGIGALLLTLAFFYMMGRLHTAHAARKGKR